MIAATHTRAKPMSSFADAIGRSSLNRTLFLVSILTGAMDCSSANIDGAGIVDMLDFALLVMHWPDSACGACDGAEQTGDGGKMFTT